MNTLITEYISSRAKRRVTANQGANTALTERIDQVRQDLAGLEKEMRDLRTKGDLVGTRAGSVGQQQVEELATAVTRATVERAQLQTSYERAVALSSQGSSDALASVLGSGTVSRLRDQEATSSRRLAELTTALAEATTALAESATVLAERDAEVAKVLQDRDLQFALAEARKTLITALEQRVRELEQKQQIARTELRRSEGQIDLIKDLLLREGSP